MTATFTLTTLKKRADFLRLNRGHKFITPFFILRYAKGEGACRVGYTVTTKCGNAVVRNRIKRRLRALVREQTNMVAADYVLIARADAEISAADAPIDSLRAELARAFDAARRKLAI